MAVQITGLHSDRLKIDVLLSPKDTGKNKKKLSANKKHNNIHIHIWLSHNVRLKDL